MKKDRMLRGVVALQAVCMIVLAVVVTNHFVPFLRAKAPASGGGSSVAGVVGDKQITEQELLAELRRKYGESTLRSMLLREAAKLEAAKYGITVTPEELASELNRLIEGYPSEADYYEQMKEQLGLTREDVQSDAEYRLLLERIATREVQVSDAQVDTYIDEHATEFEGKTELKLRWILTQSYSEANEVRGKLEDGEDFSALAAEYSIDAFTAGSGGDLGLIEEDDPFVEAAMLDTARSLSVGETTEPVETEGGYALIRLDERRVHDGLIGDALRTEARRRVALELARPLQEVEDKLLRDYNAQPKDLSSP
ncbi:peptidylprolyl isomerase [Paenibacillus kobensis]|uniref:peptidylprolyl isomerase n=1 Tax=Paenibacillus kobensis TaxID=59841 RepID=UPI000FDBA2B3|nr:peptidylprolyl isomerase [Paenibacillus kobensis]